MGLLCASLIGTEDKESSVLKWNIAEEKSNEDEVDEVRCGEEHGWLEGLILGMVRVVAKSRFGEADIPRQEREA